MSDSPRIEELRRRIERDPASMSFAQLAEELRRAGRLQESVDTCRAGLVRHPQYLAARVTLGRALLALGEPDAAAREFGAVLESAPGNLAARRALEETGRRAGRTAAALAHWLDAIHDLRTRRRA